MLIHLQAKIENVRVRKLPKCIPVDKNVSSFLRVPVEKLRIDTDTLLANTASCF